MLDRVTGWLGSLLGRGEQGGKDGKQAKTTQGARSGGTGGRSARASGKPATRAPQTSRVSRTAAAAQVVGSGGKTSDDFWAFAEALREVSPDFDRYCRVTDDDAAGPALRAVYALLPQTGKVSRVAVMRRYLAQRARTDDEPDDAALIARLSERQLIQLARRAGMPV